MVPLLEVAQEENVETEESVDISSVQEPELEEDKNTQAQCHS
jgi:hypothetical protein